MKCPCCGKETRAAIRAFGGMLFACPCVPPNTAVQVRIDQMILDAVQCDVFAFMRVEHDTGDEDLRPIDEDAECPMCNRPLREYSGRHKDPRYHGRNVCFPLPSEAWEDRAGVHLRAHADLRVHNHWRCVHQAEVFSTAQTCRARRRLFSAT